MEKYHSGSGKADVQEDDIRSTKKTITNPKADFPGVISKSLISFESGHYKEITGSWKGDSVWGHFHKAKGGMVHINKDKVEYIETFPEY